MAQPNLQTLFNALVTVGHEVALLPNLPAVDVAGQLQLMQQQIQQNHQQMQQMQQQMQRNQQEIQQQLAGVR